MQCRPMPLVWAGFVLVEELWGLKGAGERVEGTGNGQSAGGGARVKG